MGIAMGGETLVEAWQRLGLLVDPPPPVRSISSAAAAYSINSLASVGSLQSVASIGSIASLASAGSILSVWSAGSILSVGSAGSILSLASAGSILSVRSSGSILCVDNQPIAELSPPVRQALNLGIGTTALVAIGWAANRLRVQARARV